MTSVTRLTAAQHLLPSDEELRLASCSRELIRTPGAVQAHGVLLALDLDTLEITHASENCDVVLGIDTSDVLAGPLDAVLGVVAAHEVIACARSQQDPFGQPTQEIQVSVNGDFFNVIQHCVGMLLVVELEPTRPVAHERLLTLMNQTTAQITAARTGLDLVNRAARAIRVLTGFDKVMVYEFHEDGHGEVLVDDHADGMDDYLGLHFPASDIPSQARQLYVINTVRAVADSGSDAVALLTRDGWEFPPLDLARAELRAVSPHHLAFMRNMGQAASVTLALTRGDDLIGMVTCAHREPRHLPFAVRRALMILAQHVSLQMAALQESTRLKRRLEAQGTRIALTTQLRQDPQPADGLAEGELNLMSVLEADGVVVHFAGEFRRTGDGPPVEQSHAVARHLRQRQPEQIFVSASLLTDDPELAQLVPGVAGVVFVPLGSGEDYLLWVRREVLQTVRWLGDQAADNRDGPLSPRNSFSTWRQSVAGCSLPWDSEDMAQVLELRKDVLDVMLQRAQARLAHQGLHDDLTGLPNRRQAVSRLTAALRPLSAPVEIAVIFLDVDRFKFINDTYGHEVGDEVIRATAARLSLLTRPDDLVARLGGDEFMLAFFGLDEAAAVRVGRRIVAGFQRPLSTAGRTFHVAVSVGLTTTRSDSGTAPLDLLGQADTAMYLAKRRGGSQLAQFESTLRPGLVRRTELEQALSFCWQRGEFELYYQPIFALPDQTVIGAESLLRWNRPGFGLVPPDEFVPILEETGLILPVGSWVLSRTMQQLAAWKRAGVVQADFNLAVNLSARQFADPGLIGELHRQLAAYQVAPNHLTLEITETSAMSERPEVVTAVRGIAGLGVGLSIDDFGTGYSSMPMLKSLPVTQLKIDRQFVADMTSGRRDDALVAAVINIAHQFGLSCVAEGVENLEQLDRLRALNCDFVQGFLLGRPLPAAEFARAHHRTPVPTTMRDRA